MKIHYALLFCCLFVAAAPSKGFGEGAFHTFTTPDGRTLNAAVKGYNAGNGKIQIEREDGKKLWILPTVFSEPDQEYVQQWIAADQFMSPSKFKIEGKKTKNKISDKKTEVVYEITLENKTDFPIKDIRIEYHASISVKDYRKKKDSKRLDSGELHIAGIPAGGKILQTTKPMNMVKLSSPCCGMVKEEKLDGFWFNVHGPETEGKPAIREWGDPSDASRKFSLFLEKCGKSDNEEELLSAISGLWKSDPEKAIEFALNTYEISQSATAARNIGELYLFHLKPANIPLGLEWMEKAAKKNDFTACWRLAEFYATCADPQHHNPKKGIEYGLQAVSLQSDGDYRGNYYLAMAYAHDGQFEKAVEHQETVVDIHKRYRSISAEFQSYLSKMEELLKLYRNNKTQ
ncbi:MAG: hypothetical protein ABFR33_05815 [Verrucomicrobiota bacterium]